MKNLSLPLLVLLSACAMQNPSFIHDEKMHVLSEPVSTGFNTDAVSRTELAALADDIKHRAEHDVTIQVSYPLHGSRQVAQAQGEQVRQYLLAQNVRQNIRIQTQPGASSHVDVQYDALRAASSCNTSIKNADADLYDHASDSNYRFGCTHDQMLALQIARPEDLLGNDTTTLAESQRTAKSIDNYRAGENATPANTQPLTASTVYQQ